MARVFISYSREREATVRDLAEDVRSLGNTVWFDEALSGGQRWWDRILETIRDCDVFVMLLDPDSLASTACRREYDYAHALGKPILPVLVSDDVKVSLLPPALAEIQHVDYRGDGREALRRLAKALPALPEPPALPDPLPAPPEAPLSYLGGLAEKLSADADLSFEQQSALVSELRLSLRDPETAADGRVLLERMRSRRDLFAAIADEIDELQAEPAAAVTTRPDTEPEVNAVPPVEQRPATVQSTESPPKRALLRNVALAVVAVAGLGATGYWYYGAAPGPSPSVPPRIYVHIAQETQRDAAQQASNDLEYMFRDVGLNVPGIELRPGPARTEFRFFKQAEEGEATKIYNALREMGIQAELVDLSSQYEDSEQIRARHYELWFSPEIIPTL